MKLRTKNPLTVASVAGSLLFLLASAGTTPIFAIEAKDLEYLYLNTDSDSWTRSANFHVGISAFYGLALEDNFFKGEDDGMALNLYGFSIDLAYTLAQGSFFGVELAAKLDFGYGEDDVKESGTYSDWSWSDKYELSTFMWNVAGGVNFFIDSSHLRFSIGPRIGQCWMRVREKEKYYDSDFGSESYSHSRIHDGIIFGAQAQMAVKLTEHNALTFDVGYMYTTALPNYYCRDQQYLLLGLGYKYSF